MEIIEIKAASPVVCGGMAVVKGESAREID
jgi:hypothetical protein